MAISVQNTVSDLKNMAFSLGILNSIVGTKKNGDYYKEDLIVPIREHILLNKYGFIPKDYELLLSIKSPMLCKRIEELNSDCKDEIWRDDIWVFEDKIDGVRALVVSIDGNVEVFSRVNSTSDLLPIKMPIDIENVSIKEDFIIDCEITPSRNDILIDLQRSGVYSERNSEALEMMLINMNPIMSRRIQLDCNIGFIFNVIDCLYFNGWMLDIPYKERKDVVKSLVSSLGNNFVYVDYINSDKEDFFSKCVSFGSEGCVAKRLDGIYVPDTSRKKNGWIKIKKSVSKSNDANGLEEYLLGDVVISDTVEAFITGYSVGSKGSLDENKVSSLEVSVNVNRNDGSVCQSVLGNISNIEASVRDKVTTLVDGVVTLTPICYKSVVELNSLCNMILGFRYDKVSDDCCMSQSKYESLVECR